MSSFSTILPLVPLILAAAVLLAAALNDIRHFKIPNWMSLALALLFPVYALSTGTPVLPHVFACLAVFAVGFGFYALGLLGGGDVKLLAAAALWAGPEATLTLLLLTTSLGGVLAGGYAGAAYLKAKKNSKSDAESDLQPDLKVLPWHKAPVPYGVAIACGGWFILYSLARVSLA